MLTAQAPEFVPTGAAEPVADAAPVAGAKNRIYVQNLPASFAQQHFSMMFSQFGAVNECNFFAATEDGAKAKGYGFVSFADPIQAENCMDLLHGKDFSWLSENGIVLPEFSGEEGAVQMELMASLKPTLSHS